MEQSTRSNLSVQPRQMTVKLGEPVKKGTDDNTKLVTSFPHQESKKVFIRRKQSLVLLPGQDPDQANLKIGASFKNQDTLRGLTPLEEARYLPNIIGVNPTDLGWSKAAKDYWQNISRPVPAGNGLELEVGFMWFKEEDYIHDKISPETERKGTPINIADYVLYRYCLLYSRVANTIDDVGKSPNILFYIYSKETEVAAKKVALTFRRDADMLYYKNMGDRSWTDWVLRVLIAGDKQAKIHIKDLTVITEDEKDILLKEYCDKNPTLFLQIGNDKRLELKAFIETCVVHGRLIRIPNTHTITFDNTPIGHSLDEAAGFLLDAKNVQVYNTLQAQIKLAP